MKYNRNFVKEVEAAKEEDRKQEKLHEKYNQIDENKVIVEKNNFIKFFLRYGVAFLQLICRIVLLGLALIGLLSLIYPSTRNDLVTILTDCLKQLRTLL